MVMMALGAFQFSINTAAYQELTASHQYRWAMQERLGRPPAMQYLGPGDAAITLAGKILPHYRGGLGQMPALRALAGQGAPFSLVSGLGGVLGRYVVLSVDETQTMFAHGGVPLKIEFTIQLQAFGGDLV